MVSAAAREGLVVEGGAYTAAYRQILRIREADYRARD